MKPEHYLLSVYILKTLGLSSILYGLAKSLLFLLGNKKDLE